MIKIFQAYIIESPLFEIQTEDGPGSTFNLQVVAEADDGTKHTFNKTFERWDTERAQRFASKVSARGTINPNRWHVGTSWDHYATPQTYDEEKADALFNLGALA